MSRRAPSSRAEPRARRSPWPGTGRRDRRSQGAVPARRAIRCRTTLAAPPARPRRPGRRVRGEAGTPRPARPGHRYPACPPTRVPRRPVPTGRPGRPGGPHWRPPDGPAGRGLAPPGPGPGGRRCPCAAAAALPCVRDACPRVPDGGLPRATGPREMTDPAALVPPSRRPPRGRWPSPVPVPAGRPRPGPLPPPRRPRLPPRQGSCPQRPLLPARPQPTRWPPAATPDPGRSRPLAPGSRCRRSRPSA